jgi:hypothetical protein
MKVVVQAGKQTATMLKWLIGLAFLAALVALVINPPPTAEGSETAANNPASPVLAAPNFVPPAVEVSSQTPADDRACRLCHADTEAVLTFPSGETLPVQVDVDTLSDSAHGMHLETPLACTSCHARRRPNGPFRWDALCRLA